MFTSFLNAGNEIPSRARQKNTCKFLSKYKNCLECSECYDRTRTNIL